MTITDTQRAVYLAKLREERMLGDVPALRAAGVEGTAGELRRMVEDDPELREEAWLARGWDWLPAVDALAAVAVDTEHRSWNQANERWLRARGGKQFQDKSRLELTGADGGPVEVADRSSSLAEVQRVLAAAANTEDGGGTADDVLAPAGVVVAAPEDV